MGVREGAATVMTGAAIAGALAGVRGLEARTEVSAGDSSAETGGILYIEKRKM